MNRPSFPDFVVADGDLDLTKLLVALAEGCKVISHLVNNVGLSDIIGHTGSSNVHGEDVQKLDDLTNKILTDYLTASETCAGFVSEENEHILTLNAGGKFTIAVDPLDGSSNIDVAAPIGTIFCVHERLTAPGGDVEGVDFLQKGTATRAAGYFIYGSSTMLIISTGRGVNGFTLNTADNEFYLSHPNIMMPEKGKIYSINQGNAQKYDDGLRNFLNYCGEVDKDTSRPYSLRYIGSMVGDIHRNLIKGGIFIYPANKGETKGKLRLLYECIPMSFIVEQAGGKASDGKMRILEIQPTDFHERCAIFIGSKNLMDKALEFVNQ
ncbi:MAG: fructose 1,6-bisphosphatase [Bacteroidota bacterium]|nr:fructose 1,6-bisphosphatase [Bacteroidota bacterium]